MILQLTETLRIKDIDSICVAIQKRQHLDKKTGEYRWKGFSFFGSWDRALADVYKSPYLIFKDEGNFIDMWEEHVKKIQLFIKQYKNGRKELCTELHQKDRVRGRRKSNKNEDKPGELE